MEIVKKHSCLFLPIDNNRYYKRDKDDNLETIIELVKGKDIEPIYVGRGFYKVMDGLYTDLLGYILLENHIHYSTIPSIVTLKSMKILYLVYLKKFKKIIGSL